MEGFLPRRGSSTRLRMPTPLLDGIKGVYVCLFLSTASLHSRSLSLPLLLDQAILGRPCRALKLCSL